MPGVPRGDGTDTTVIEQRHHHHRTCDPDVQDVPERDARRVLRAMEARSRSRRAATCVVYRSRWRQPNREREQEQYMNLAAYMNDDGDVTMQSAEGVVCAG
jgi:hypothetical protein